MLAKYVLHLSLINKGRLVHDKYDLLYCLLSLSPAFSSVVEKPQRRVTEHDPVFIRRLDTLGVHDTSARGREVPHAALPRPVHIISKWEERVARARHPIQLARPRLALFLSQRRRHTLKLGFPLLLFTTLEDLSAHEQIDRVCLFGALDALFEREGEDARVVAKPPQVGFAPRESGTVNAGLLASPQTDDGTIFSIRNAVGLGVFQCKGGDEQICQGLRGKLCRRWSMIRAICGTPWTCLLVLADNVGKERRVDLGIVSALL